MIAVYRAWVDNKKDYKFCIENALDVTALHEIDRLRSQYRHLIIDALNIQADNCNDANDDALLTSCCIVGGLYPNVCALVRPNGPKDKGKLITSDTDAPCRPSSNSFQRNRVLQASKSGKDAYAMYHAKHRTIGAVSARERRPPETYLSDVNFVSKFALLLFGGTPEIAKNAIVIDKWLKFKVSADDESVKQNAVLILSLREVLDEAIMDNVNETYSDQDDKKVMVERRKSILKVVRKILAEEG